MCSTLCSWHELATIVTLLLRRACARNVWLYTYVLCPRIGTHGAAGRAASQLDGTICRMGMACAESLPLPTYTWAAKLCPTLLATAGADGVCMCACTCNVHETSTRLRGPCCGATHRLPIYLSTGPSRCSRAYFITMNEECMDATLNDSSCVVRGDKCNPEGPSDATACT